ncbi:MAG TPA: hypothetical protein VLA59_10375 [Patescibacteria group bacterium]|nr:hypothetical protein [Patescibacteria group bacterium]
MLSRTTIRHAGAVVAAAMAVIYFLIGAGVLQVVTANEDPGFLFVFGAMAGGAFLLGALLLMRFDRRWLWMLGAAFQVFVYWGYFAVAPDRTPAFEPWGITLRVVQVPLLIALLYLAVRPSEQRTAEIRR